MKHSEQMARSSVQWESRINEQFFNFIESHLFWYSKITETQKTTGIVNSFILSHPHTANFSTNSIQAYSVTNAIAFQAFY